MPAMPRTIFPSFIAQASTNRRAQAQAQGIGSVLLTILTVFLSLSGPSGHSAFAAVMDAFNVGSESKVRWGSDTREQTLMVPYQNELSFTVNTSEFTEGPIAEDYSIAQSRYQLQLNGSGFGTRAVISKGFHLLPGPARQAQTEASSSSYAGEASESQTWGQGPASKPSRALFRSMGPQASTTGRQEGPVKSKWMSLGGTGWTPQGSHFLA